MPDLEQELSLNSIPDCFTTVPNLYSDSALIKGAKVNFGALNSLPKIENATNPTIDAM
ncbi:hypothetical protein TUMSATVNIG3_18690 [Vibrio nigripulchritudo]|nr:hypothetical protein TUMSATVNIG3_18690 [Vibrio nigripulchritudo]